MWVREYPLDKEMFQPNFPSCLFLYLSYIGLWSLRQHTTILCPLLCVAVIKYLDPKQHIGGRLCFCL